MAETDTNHEVHVDGAPGAGADAPIAVDAVLDEELRAPEVMRDASRDERAPADTVLEEELERLPDARPDAPKHVTTGSCAQLKKERR
jgi:hypothetical protein